MKRVCVVTGTRAEYGLLRWVMEGIRESSSLDLQLIVTGMHLSPEFGLTAEGIEADGFVIDKRVEMLMSSDTPVGVTKSMGLAMIGFADAFADLKPDLLLVLGDRYEIFAAASAAMIARIPIAHIHGGEVTEGAFDDAMRHSISKMSHLHFVAADQYKNRVIQMGEAPNRVFLVGGLGVDVIKQTPTLSRKELEETLDFELQPRNLLITFHPVTLEDQSSERHINELLAALGDLHDTGLIFTLPNADTDSRIVSARISEFCNNHPSAKEFVSLGQERYLSCIQHFDGVIGNSSSGLTEVPSYKKGTVNIGDRQRGRLKAQSVIDCEPDEASIKIALDRLFSESFRADLYSVENPYGTGGASKRIVEILDRVEIDALLKKGFWNFAI